jgi:lysophosphatidate acyltransferase
VLTPRIKATHVAFDSMKSYLDAIYDVTVVYEGKDDNWQQKEAPTMTGECALTYGVPALCDTHKS